MNKHTLFSVLTAVLSVFFLTGCKQTASDSSDTQVQKPKYARLFSAHKHPQGKLVKVYDPVDTSKVLKQYFLYKDQSPTDIPDNTPAIKIPLENVACAHSTQIGYVKALGKQSTIHAVGSKALLEKKSILAGRDDIGEFFNGWQLDLEKLISINPQAVFFTPGGNENLNSAKDTHIPILLELSAWESHPLARCEWVKFVAMFYELEDKADSIFTDIETNYLYTASQAIKMNDRPSILSSYPYQNVWWLPAGQSYKALMYKDAALTYPWADTKGIGSLGLDFEQVLKEGHQSDVWFMEFGFVSDFTKNDFLKQNPLYARFKAFANDKLFVCNTDEVPYFENGIMEPHKILEDYIHLSRSTAGYTPHYYKQMR